MKRVLIADDLGDQRAVYVTSLVLAGFVVDEASDGGQVIEVVTDHRPDVIVGLITTQPPKELAPTDCELRDWRQAGLHQPSFFRLFR